MNIRKLVLIPTAVLAIAVAGDAFGQEQNEQHEGHHPEAADTSAASSASSESGERSGDDMAPGGPAASSGMMMCQPMMAQMMGKGSMMSKMTMMGQDGADKGMTGSRMMGMSMMGPEGAATAHAGFPKLIAVDAIKLQLEKIIAENKRLKVGKIEPGGDFSLAAEITTLEGSLVHKLLIDRRDGSAYEVE